jgi:4-amino-4-deoxy-L-arabinose transferase-like glycosyltransferase
MNDTPSICAETPADNSFRKISRAAVVFVTLYVWYFSPLGAFGFIGAHQPRYPRIAREMAKSGDWVTPQLYGKPWCEKPVFKLNIVESRK